MTHETITAVIDAWLHNQKYQLIYREAEVERRIVGDSVRVVAKDFPAILSHGPGSREATITPGELHHNQAVREHGLEPFITGILDRLVEDLVGDRVQDDDVDDEPDDSTPIR
jgi:hypothetical protein